MRFVSADKVFLGDGRVLENGVVGFDSSGQILHVFTDQKNPIIPDGELEILPGTICPGFVNAHCHLELSHLHRVLHQGTGLPSFLTGVTKLRKSDPREIEEAMVAADQEMFDNGINLVGDISNGTDSIKVKASSKIKYHTFVELIGFDESMAEDRFNSALTVLNQFEAESLQASISPHANYSLSDKLRNLLSEYNTELNLPISTHNQETESEDTLFKNKTGKLMQTFLDFGLSMDDLEVTGKSALRSTLKDFHTNGPLLLVHNSCTEIEEMKWAISKRENLFWCSCPSANIYIELRSPKVSDWLKAGAQVCVGTDSLASNHQLSILKEMELTQSRSPEISLDQLITIATFNGAKALGQESSFGQLTVGTSPGIINLSGSAIDRGLINGHVKLTRLA